MKSLAKILSLALFFSGSLYAQVANISKTTSDNNLTPGSGSIAGGFNMTSSTPVNVNSGATLTVKSGGNLVGAAGSVVDFHLSTLSLPSLGSNYGLPRLGVDANLAALLASTGAYPGQWGGDQLGDFAIWNGSAWTGQLNVATPATSLLGSATITGATVTLNGTTHTNTTIDGLSSTAGIVVGSLVAGTGVQTKTLVTAVAANSVTVSLATTASATVSLLFTAPTTPFYPVLDVLNSDLARPSPRYANFWHCFKKINSGSAYQIRVFEIGDSMLDTSLVTLSDDLANLWGGVAGYGSPMWVTYAGGASHITADYTTWINGTYSSVPVGGSVAFDWNVTDPVLSNTFELYYIKESGGGTFKIQYQDDGGSWTDLAGYTSVSYSNGTKIGAAVTGALPGHSYYRIRVVGLTGSIAAKIIGATLYDSTRSGVVFYSNQIGGTQLSQYTTTSTAITQPIMAVMAPDLIVYSNTDLPQTQTSLLPTLYTNLSGSSSDFLGIGVNPTLNENGFDQAGAATYDQTRQENEAIKKFCDSVHGAYWDNYSHLIDWATLNTGGLALDAVHLNLQGSYLSTGKMFQELDMNNPVFLGPGYNKNINLPVISFGGQQTAVFSATNPSVETSNHNTFFPLYQRKEVTATFAVIDKATNLIVNGFALPGTNDASAPNGFRVFGAGGNGFGEVNGNGLWTLGPSSNVHSAYVQAEAYNDIVAFKVHQANTGGSANPMEIWYGAGTGTRIFYVSNTGVITADGSGLTALNATNLASGTVPMARLSLNVASGLPQLDANAMLPTFTSPTVSGTGTISGSGATITGVGTAFTTQCKVGSVIQSVGGAIQCTVVSIASNTSLTVYPPIASGSGLAYNILPPSLSLATSLNGSIFAVDGYGQRISVAADGNYYQNLLYNKTASKGIAEQIDNSGNVFWLFPGTAVPYTINNDAMHAALTLTSSGFKTGGISYSASSAPSHADGTNATATVTGSNLDGTLQVVVAGGATSGVITTLTLSGSQTFPTKATMTLTPANAATATLAVTTLPYITGTATTTVMNTGAAGLPVGTYLWNYHIGGY